MKWLWLIFVLMACESGDKRITSQPAPKIPSTPNKEVLSDGAASIQIRLGASDKSLIEGNVVEVNELKSALRSAKRAKGDTATVVIHLTSDTEFGTFTKVHETLEDLLQEERDSIAQLRFNLRYDELSETQMAVINRKHHLRIIEKMNR